jgi:hypothetical protein
MCSSAGGREKNQGQLKHHSSISGMILYVEVVYTCMHSISRESMEGNMRQLLKS